MLEFGLVITEEGASISRGFSIFPTFEHHEQGFSTPMSQVQSIRKRPWGLVHTHNLHITLWNSQYLSTIDLPGGCHPSIRLYQRSFKGLSRLIIQLICRASVVKACNLSKHHARRIIETYLERDVEPLHLKSPAIIALYLLSLEVLEIRYGAYKTSCCLCYRCHSQVYWIWWFKFSFFVFHAL